MRPVFEWNIGSRVLTLGKRTLVMGVLNVTSDSFSDGGQFLDPGLALEQGLKLLQEGADIVDVGGESTRPGAKIAGGASKSGKAQGTEKDKQGAERVTERVSEKEELERIIPVIAALKQKQPKAVISVDTYKSAVARAAIKAGAEIVNDISGFRWDPLMRKLLVELKCGAILMHSRGRPEEWRNLPKVADIVTLVKRELREWVDAALMAGVKRDTIALDPGFGFGKNFDDNYPLLKRFDEFHQLRYPLIAGVSRKSFIGRALARGGKDAPVPDRLYGTLGAEAAVVFKGAHVVRTHDVRACVEALKLADLVVT